MQAAAGFPSSCVRICRLWGWALTAAGLHLACGAVTSCCPRAWLTSFDRAPRLSARDPPASMFRFRHLSWCTVGVLADGVAIFVGQQLNQQVAKK